jgi:hypothetical protein
MIFWLLIYRGSKQVSPGYSAVSSETWSLVWEWSSFTSVISGAPSSSFAHSGASAFPGLGALLSTLPVVGFGDGAVLVVWMSSSVFGPVGFPESLTVIIVFSIFWNDVVSKTNSWWFGINGEVLIVVGSGLYEGEQSSDSKEFHNVKQII